MKFCLILIWSLLITIFVARDNICHWQICVLIKQGMDDVQVRGAATDIFSYLVEYNPSMVREFVMQESQQNDDVSIFRFIKEWHSCYTCGCY